MTEYSDEPLKGDLSLLQAYRNGHKSALTKVFQTYAPEVRRYIQRGFVFNSHGHTIFFRGVRQISDVDDIVQETFRRAFCKKARHKYDGVRSYRSYLCAIAKNVVIDEMRMRQKWVSVDDEDVCLDQELNAQMRSASADEQMENIEVFCIVAAFLETLEDDAKKLFQTRFLRLESQEHTAAMLGWTRARVRKVEAQIRKSFVRLAAYTGYLGKHETIAQRTYGFNQTLAARSRDLWRAQPVSSTAADAFFDPATP